MDFNQYHNQAWADHASDAQKVANNFHQGHSLISSIDQIPQMAGLITHVMGEHLGKWSEGIEELLKLKKNSLFVKETAAEKSIARSVAALQIGEKPGSDQILSSFNNSDQIMILSVAASALVKREMAHAKAVFNKALALAGNIDAKDPANRSLAVTTNNLAAEFEEKKSLTVEESQMMVECAKAARKYWEIAGTWMHVERAEYRLAKVFLKAGDLQKALIAANNCLDISLKNNAPLLELFFAYEAQCCVHKKSGDLKAFEQSLKNAQSSYEAMPEDDKKWCTESLSKLQL